MDEIIKKTKEYIKNSEFYFAIVGYRDFDDDKY